MKFLSVEFDNVISRPYKLYSINARELNERIRANYPLSEVHLQLFNSDSGIAKTVQMLRQYIDYGYTERGDKTDPRYKDLYKQLAKVKEGKILSEQDKLGLAMGYQLMPIAVSTAGDFEDPGICLELLDGFKRTFIPKDCVPDTNVLVKVYPVLNDAEWINSMILFNSWKFFGKNDASVYMDRGFQLGFYKRFNIKLHAMLTPFDYDIYKLVDIYTFGNDYSHVHFNMHPYWMTTGREGLVYETFWNNDCVAKDIQAMYSMITYLPVFRRPKRGGEEEIVDCRNMNRGYQSGRLSRICECFICVLGEIRRMEYARNMTKRKPFDLQVFRYYLARPDKQKDFIKIMGMSVDGFVKNYISSHLAEEIIKVVYESMGYELPPKRNEFRHEV